MGGSRRITWLVFFIGVIAVVDVLGWVTWRMVRLEQEQARTRDETARQEAIGRALWRMDSIVLPILAVESARPYFEYQAFYPANRPFDRMWDPIEPNDTLVPSPLLGEPGDFVRLHFEREPSGRLTSPQAPPAGQSRDAAVAAGVPESLLAMADLRLYELDRLAKGSPPANSLALSNQQADESTGDWGFVVPAPNFNPLTADDRLESQARVAYVATIQDQNPGPAILEPLSRSLTVQPPRGEQTAPPPVESVEALGDARAVSTEPPPEPAPGQPGSPDPADLRQDYGARQQAANYAQNLNDASRLNRQRGYEGRSGGAGSPSASAPAAAAPAAGPTEPVAASEQATALENSPRYERSAAQEPPPSTARPSPRNAEAAPGAVGLAAESSGQSDPDSRGRDRAEAASEPNATTESPGRSPVARESIPLGDALGGGVSVDELHEPGTWADPWSGTRPDSGALIPQWRGAFPDTSADPALLLVRDVHIGDQTREQGVWIDWPALRLALEASVADVFPLAQVRPLANSNSTSAIEAQRLATIPVLLIPGPLAPGLSPPIRTLWTPTRWTLLVGWITVVISVIAIGIVLRKAIDLGERRGRFVSAVSHELRTPLTTFRLYSQMLAGGGITDESKRTRYAQTLDRESQRLSGIVESVLEYARLGRRSAAVPARQRLSPAAIIDRVRPALAGRCERAGIPLVLPEPASLPAVAINADADKLERILLNLVDNACKYAADAPDPRIVVDAQVRENRLVLSVRDFGPGVPAAERRRIFNAFHRAKHHDASASPGLGLGLALSRGLAREMAGELRLADTTPGALFELSLPLA